MGFNTTVVILNDALDEIRDDPEFGRKLFDAIVSLRSGKKAYVDAGCHGNAAVVIETHHAAYSVTVLVGGNSGIVLGG